MDIKVNGCHNCPFLDSNYDDYATIDYCSLASHLNKKEYIISIYNNLDSSINMEPDWCPLKKEEFVIKISNYDIETKTN